MLLQQFLPATPQISSEFFIFQQDSAPAHGALRRSYFELLSYFRNTFKTDSVNL